jgi:hypothetical protein
MKRWLTLLFVLPAISWAGAKQSWVLDRSTLTYHVVHRLHKVQGASTTARGKGVCEDKGCQFLVAAPVGSFVSGDTNRDLHMIETTRGASFPLVKVQTRLPSVPTAKSFTADLTVEFAGKTHDYKAVPFTVEAQSPTSLRFKGVVPLAIADFEIPAPSLLGMAIKNDVPVDVDMEWTVAAK